MRSGFVIGFVAVFFMLAFLVVRNSTANDAYTLLYAEQGYAPDDVAMKVYYQEPIGFGPHAVRVISVHNLDGDGEGNETLLLEEKIYNDGAALTPANAGIRRLNTGVELILRGAEQDPVTYMIIWTDDAFFIEAIE